MPRETVNGQKEQVAHQSGADRIARLALGTAQFGLDYGVSNSSGQVPPEVVGQILIRAEEAGVRTIDTAFLYGESEQVLGHALRPESAMEIVTKTSKCPDATVGEGYALQLDEDFELSLSRLNRKSVYGLLLHDAEDLLIPGGGRLVRRLTDIRERGTATKIGVSIYDGDQLNAVLERFQPDIVQLPLSILDQRLIRSGHLKRLKSLGVEIHARSLFLQGLMFMDLDHLDPFFKPISKSLSQLRLATQEQGLTPLAAALSFGLAQAELDRIVVGVCSLVELNQIIEAVATETTSMDFSRFAISNPTFVNPSLWRLQST